MLRSPREQEAPPLYLSASLPQNTFGEQLLNQELAPHLSGAARSAQAFREVLPPWPAPRHATATATAATAAATAAATRVAAALLAMALKRNGAAAAAVTAHATAHATAANAAGLPLARRGLKENRSRARPLRAIACAGSHRVPHVHWLGRRAKAAEKNAASAAAAITTPIATATAAATTSAAAACPGLALQAQPLALSPVEDPQAAAVASSSLVGAASIVVVAVAASRTKP